MNNTPFTIAREIQERIQSADLFVTDFISRHINLFDSQWVSFVDSNANESEESFVLRQTKRFSDFVNLT